MVWLNRPDLVLPPNINLNFFNCPIIVLFNIKKIYQNTQFVFELQRLLESQLVSSFPSIRLIFADFLFSFFSLVNELQISDFFKTKKGLISIQLALLNIIAMIGLIIVYANFNLTYSTILNILDTLLWVVLLVQRFMYGPVKKSSKKR